MTNLADQVIAALRAGHDDLAAYAETLTVQDLTSPSGATEWDVAHLLSHLGSGAEIGRAAVEHALSGGSVPDGFNQGVWARWDALGPAEMRDGFVESNRALVERYESLDGTARRELRIDLGFLPAPLSLGEAARLRLSEFALHAWDARAAADPGVRVAPEAVPLAIDGLTGLLGWIAKPDAMGGRRGVLAVELSDPERSFGLELGEKVSLSGTPPEPDGVLRMPAEAWLRLITGRLRPASTPANVEVTGPVALDDLRKVFPGY